MKLGKLAAAILLLAASTQANFVHAQGCGCADAYGSCGCGGGDAMYGEAGCGCAGSHSCAKSCQTTPGWIAGYEQTFVKPHFADSPALPANSILLTTPEFAPAVAAFGATDFEYEAAPRAWLGYVDSDGLGFRGRYWEFDESANSFSLPNVPDFGDVTTGESDLRAMAIDVEATQQVYYSAWAFAFSGGVRYAELEQATSIIRTDGFISELFIGSNDFEGWGPTVSIEALRPIRGTNLALFANGRFSLLFGDGTSNTFFADDAGGPQTILAERDDLLTILELQFGAEWSRVMYNGSRLFIRTALESQVWQDAGTGAGGDGDLGFFGGAVAVGITR